MKIQESGVPGAKQHFAILDGLRGVAALGVVVFHFMEWVYPDYSKNVIGHGFLAVDFFFCLSGFVMGYAYDDRIGTIGLRQFFTSRLIRLHPLVILGAVLGVLGFFFDPFDKHETVYSNGTILLVFLSTAFLIPFPAMKDRFFNLFPLNAPAWSLFWEYVANIFYAFILCRISRRYLMILTAVFAVILCYVSFSAGNLMGGWSKDNFWHGGARLAYSFTAGLLIYRSDWIIKNRLGFTGLTVLLVLALLMPVFNWNWLAESIVVALYFPLLVSLGAGATLSSRSEGFCLFSGKLSYPLYMTHYAGIWVFGHYYTSLKPQGITLALVIAGGTVLLVLFAYLAMILYDIPLRKYLTGKRTTGDNMHSFVNLS